MKVLFFAQRFPYPMDTGGKIRTGKLLEELNKLFDVTFISNVEHPKDDPYLSQVHRLCRQFLPVPWEEVAKYSAAFYIRILRRMWSRFPISVINDYSVALEQTLLSALAKERYDLLICDFLQPSLNCRGVTGCPTVLFQHNVESVIVERYAETATNPFMKGFWRMQWRKMHRYEGEACRRFTGVIAVSEVDKALMEREFGVRNVSAIPTGVDTEFFSPGREPVIPNSLVFTGSMDWLPNEDALLFFAEEILGKIKTRIPDVTVSIVGRKPSARLLEVLARYPEMKVIGRVDDVRPYISRHAVYIIPLRIGGGTRIKFYEAMAMGKAVVSTRIGAEGLPVTHGANVILADKAEDFADAVTRLLSDVAVRRRLESASRLFVEQNCSWKKAASVFADICSRVATTGRS